MKPDASKVIKVNEPYNKKITIPFEGRTFLIEYGKYGDDLVFYEEGDTTPYEVNKLIIQRIGDGFNALLNQGQYQDYFIVPNNTQ